MWHSRKPQKLKVKFEKVKSIIWYPASIRLVCLGRFWCGNHLDFLEFVSKMQLVNNKRIVPKNLSDLPNKLNDVPLLHYVTARSVCVHTYVPSENEANDGQEHYYSNFRVTRMARRTESDETNVVYCCKCSKVQAGLSEATRNSRLIRSNCCLAWCTRDTMCAISDLISFVYSPFKCPAPCGPILQSCYQVRDCAYGCNIRIYGV